jgi:hypothetical protein
MINKTLTSERLKSGLKGSGVNRLVGNLAEPNEKIGVSERRGKQDFEDLSTPPRSDRSKSALQHVIQRDSPPPSWAR